MKTIPGIFLTGILVCGCSRTPVDNGPAPVDVSVQTTNLFGEWTLVSAPDRARNSFPNGSFDSTRLFLDEGGTARYRSFPIEAWVGTGETSTSQWSFASGMGSWNLRTKDFAGRPAHQVQFQSQVRSLLLTVGTNQAGNLTLGYLPGPDKAETIVFQQATK